MTCLSLKVTDTDGFSLPDKILKSTAHPDFCCAGILAMKRRTGFALAAKGSNLTATLVKYLVIIADSSGAIFSFGVGLWDVRVQEVLWTPMEMGLQKIGYCEV